MRLPASRGTPTGREYGAIDTELTRRRSLSSAYSPGLGSPEWDSPASGETSRPAACSALTSSAPRASSALAAGTASASRNSRATTASDAELVRANHRAGAASFVDSAWSTSGPHSAFRPGCVYSRPSRATRSCAGHADPAVWPAATGLPEPADISQPADVPAAPAESIRGTAGSELRIFPSNSRRQTAHIKPTHNRARERMRACRPLLPTSSLALANVPTA